MKARNLIQIFILMAVSIRIAKAQDLSFARPSELLTKPFAVASDTSGKSVTVAETVDIASWLITDEESRWSADEVEILRHVLQNTLDALATNGIDGVALLEGYRFRHDAGRYINDVIGLVAKVNHSMVEITVTDKAIADLNAFTIYHELGHAVDHRLNRQLSEGFHGYTEGLEISRNSEKWQTADNFWLRRIGRDDPEEATADAFAVLVMATHAGLEQPIFDHQPLATEYVNISNAVSLALQDTELDPIKIILR